MGNGFIKFIKYIIDSTIKLVYPASEACIICNNDHEEDYLACKSCRGKLECHSIKNVLSKEGTELVVFSAAYYSSIIKELIIRLKYQGDFEAGELLAELLGEVVKKEKLEFDLVTFVPSTRKVMKKRGYNQSEYLARQLGKKLGKQVKQLVKKSRDTLDQIGLDGEARWNNLKGCFQVVERKKLSNKSVILIDDVITTGATAFSCCKLLLENGCNNVMVLTVAKSKI